MSTGGGTPTPSTKPVITSFSAGWVSPVHNQVHFSGRVQSIYVQSLRVVINGPGISTFCWTGADGMFECWFNVTNPAGGLCTAVAYVNDELFSDTAESFLQT